MKDLSDISGPGVDEQLKDYLKRWGFSELTDVQAQALESGIASDRSFIVCAPTSSGKTLVGEIALLQALRTGRRCLYLVSHKALADQKYEDFERRFGGDDADPPGTVALSTGDREEGDLNADILIATYEKGSILVLTGQIDPGQSLVVADELQILGEKGRGPNIEILCSVLRQRGTAQFVGLTATVENPEDVTAWLHCGLIQSHVRDIELRQEIWYEGHGYGVVFGEDYGDNLDPENGYPGDAINAVSYLIDAGRAPVLVFTESRSEASRYANQFARQRQRHAAGIGLAQQLDFFSEPTERSNDLRNSTERRVAFHTADLSPQERQVIEQGFLDNHFDVCFATSTLAAGVNFPFQTVVFPKLTYEYGDRQGTRMTRSEYRNMSGRAGRLSMHEVGYAVLLPQNSPELYHANALVLPENDRVHSQLADLSMRRTVLVLVAASIGQTKHALTDFFKNTFYWHLTLERNPAKLEQVLENAGLALEWLVENELVEQFDDSYLVTPLGQATARTGLLPTTACAFAELLAQHSKEFEENFDYFAGGLIHWVCGSDEFIGQAQSRFLPYPVGGQAPGSASFVAGMKLLRPLDRTNSQLCQSVHALILFTQGVPERKIAHSTHMSSGSVHRLAREVGWILDGLHLIAAVPDLDCPQSVGNQLAMLSRRVRWGSTVEALDIIRIAERARVPGLGRQRAMSLLGAGLSTFVDLANAGIKRLTDILQSQLRAKALLAAIAEHTEFDNNRLSAAHTLLAKHLGIEKIVEACLHATGTEYEVAIVDLLNKEKSWKVTVLDDGRNQNVPDILLELGNQAVLIEAKTCLKKSGLIKKEDAFAVLQKAADYGVEMSRVTLGKPHFDETSKAKAMASRLITLVEHTVFVEAFLRVLAGEITPNEFISWLTVPGVSEIARIPGSSTDLLN